MKTTIIILIIIIFLVIGIVIGYLLLPSIIQSAGGIGEGVFGSSPGVEPPLMPS